MSLRAKIALILATVVLLYAGLDHVIQRTLVFDSFVELEQELGRRDLDRALRALSGEIDQLTSVCRGSAGSEDTYRFAAEGGPRALEENVLPQAFRGRELTLVYVCDLRGRVVWGRARDSRTGGDVKLRDFPAQELAETHPLMPQKRRPRIAGVMRTEVGPLLVSAQPIVGSKKGAPSRGTLILGCSLDSALVERLAAQCGVSFLVFDVDGEGLPADVAAVRDELTSTQERIVRARDEELLVACATFRDVRGNPALIVRTESGREVTQGGARAVRYGLTSTIAAGALLLLVLLNVLQRTVLRPIGELTHHAVTVGQSEDYTRRLRSERADEIGVLSREFDLLIERVEQSRAATVKAARAAGMSEIATGVLHNVGNVLNSVNVSATLVSDRVRGSAAGDLSKVVRALEPHQGDLPGFLARDAKGRHLYPLLASIAGELESERAKVDTEIKAMCAGIEHVKELIQAQQGYAGRSGVLEVIAIAEQVDAALAFTGQALQGRGAIDVVREYDALPACRVDRHRLMEILVNLIQNARQSMQEAGVEPRLVLRVRAQGEGRVRIEVEDNGVGIAADNLARVFTHGFTTKKTGHGFGLHASANAAREMGGSLGAHSDGPGRGATFALEFPAHAAVTAGALA